MRRRRNRSGVKMTNKIKNLLATIGTKVGFSIASKVLLEKLENGSCTVILLNGELNPKSLLRTYKQRRGLLEKRQLRFEGLNESILALNSISEIVRVILIDGTNFKGTCISNAKCTELIACFYIEAPSRIG